MTIVFKRMPCSGKSNDGSTNDNHCGYRKCCSYPNNVWRTLSIQLLVIGAVIMTTAALLQCNFVRVLNVQQAQIDEFTIETIFHGVIPPGYTNTNATVRSLGLFSWENINGECKHPSLDVLEIYWSQLLDGDWDLPLRMAIVTSVFSVIALTWVIIVLTCIEHSQLYRFGLVVLLCIILPICQGMLYTVLSSAICVDNNCELGDAGNYAGISTVLYFIAGFVLLLNPNKKSSSNNDDGNPSDHDIVDNSSVEIPVERKMNATITSTGAIDLTSTVAVLAHRSTDSSVNDTTINV